MATPRQPIRDHLIHDIEDYDVLNEMYSIGWVLSDIFTGRGTGSVGAFGR
jgi:hypothetical protein